MTPDRPQQKSPNRLRRQTHWQDIPVDRVICGVVVKCRVEKNPPLPTSGMRSMSGKFVIRQGNSRIPLKSILV
jgi:hypothetical protein